MNRAERRRIAKGAPKESRKGISKELKRRDLAGWCSFCTFEQHDKCSMGNCECPCNNQRLKDQKGEEVKDVTRRRSGLYVARPRLEVPK